MEQKDKITVFGATGRIGKELLGFLSQAKIPAIAVTRDINKAVTIPFVEWVEADMNSKESLPPAMAKSKAVFLSSSMSNEFVKNQSNVIEAAKQMGVMHIVKLSSGAADKNSPFYIAKAHGEIEEILKTSDVAYTILQPTGFMQNWLGELLHTVKTERKIYEATGKGKRAYIDLRDIAEVAFKILINPDKHNLHTYVLTGGEAVNYDRIAEIISCSINEPVTFVELTQEEAALRMQKKGMPDSMIQTFVAYAENQRTGKADFVSNAVPEILHKPARTVDAFMEEHAGLFK